MRSIRLAILIALVGILAPAATLERLTLDDLILKSTGIVRGRVTGTSAALHGSVVYTHYRVQVIERWKGAGTADLDVVVAGGVAGGMRQFFPGSPKLVDGGEYVLFLWTGSSGLTNIAGLSQGILEVTRDGKDAVASRPAITDSMLDASGQIVKDEPVRMKIETLRERVSATLAQGARK